MKDKPYQPIDCNLYDVYIDWILKQRDVIINEEIRTKLTDIYTRDKVEYVKTLEGIEYRLDEVVIRMSF